MPQRALPFVFINGAPSADGKLASAGRRFIRFSSERDQQDIYELRATADAILCGAETAEAFHIDLRTGPEKYRRARIKHGLAEEPLRVIVTATCSIKPTHALFRTPGGQIVIITTSQAATSRVGPLEAVGAVVKKFGSNRVNLRRALEWLAREFKVRRIVAEGGGELNASLVAADLVEELHMTICPLVVAGRSAPTIIDGHGFRSLEQTKPLKLKSLRRIGDELFLVYKFKR